MAKRWSRHRRVVEFSPQLKLMAKVRTKFRCERCGDRENNLQCHHIGHPRDASLFNCLVLCEPCHVAEHR